jgi:transcription elongation factor GreA
MASRHPGGLEIAGIEPTQVSLSEALTRYLSNPRSVDAPEVQQELNKFIRWCGRDRSMTDLKPQEAAEYGEMLAASTMGSGTGDSLQALKDFLSFCFKTKLTQTSLSKHVKARKTTRRSNRQERARVSIDISPEGYNNILQELESLREERVQVARDIRLAAADKDFRENAPLDAAREKQGHLEARVRELEAILQAARLTDPGAPDAQGHEERRVKVGSRVRLKDLASGDEMVYTLVNASEASPMDYKMSSASPVGRALMDHRVGEEVVVATPRGDLRYRVEALE